MQNHSLSEAENRNEMDRLGKAHGATGTKVLEFKAATESTKVVVDQAAKAGQDYINSLDLQFAALNAQISAGRELTKTCAAARKSSLMTSWPPSRPSSKPLTP